jgi:molecular chaperone GrpE
MTNKNDENDQQKTEEPIEKTSKGAEEEKTKDTERVEELENQLKRALADYQNLEKRVSEEKRIWVQQANKGMLLRLLPAIDTLELALKHAEDKGIQMAITQVMQALKDEGVEKIKTEGEEFDPHRMECVQTVDGPDGKVIQELRSGYILYDKVLRPAQVTVGKGS